LPYWDSEHSKVIDMIRQFSFIRAITFYNGPTTKNYLMEPNIHFMIVESPFLSEDTCGEVHSDFFSINIKHFSESQHVNSCLNCKVGINRTGGISNCPSIQKTYGDVKQSSIKDAIERMEANGLSRIRKDQIEVCKDCEFRHVCTDCRAYITEQSNIFSKPAKCKYDPYSATWSQ